MTGDDKWRAAVHEFAANLTRVIDETREHWREAGGGTGQPFLNLTLSALARVFVRELIEGYRRRHGYRPTYAHLVATLADTPMVFVCEASEQLGASPLDVGVAVGSA
jgi:hypothetical protein